MREISLRAAYKQRWSDPIRYTLISAWALTAVVLVTWLLRTYGLSRPIALLGVVATFALAGILVSKSLISSLDASIMHALPADLSHLLSSTLHAALPNYINHANQEISKLGHWLAFFLLSFIAVSLLPKARLLPLMAALVTLACASETLQFLTDERSPHIIDVFVDCVGIVCGMLLALPLRWAITRNQKRSDKPSTADTQV